MKREPFLKKLVVYFNLIQYTPHYFNYQKESGNMLKSLMLLWFILVLNLNANISSYENAPKNTLPEPYNSIKILPFDGRGHFGKNQSEGLTYLIGAYRVKTVVEIGSYLGASTRFIAKLLPQDGKVYAIDHWLGNSEWQNKPGFKNEQPLLYQKFLSNIVQENLCEKIIPIKMTSIEASRNFNDIPDLIFIDGSHDFKSVYKDICAWYPFVKNKGILCGDDYNWGKHKPVRLAVLRFAKEHNLQVKTINNWIWYYER